MSSMAEIFNAFEGHDPVEQRETVNEVLEKDSEHQETKVETVAPAFEMMPPAYYTKNRQRHQLVFEGACSHCAHCGQPLTDAVSIERGIGPVCSKKGYLEDPMSGVDEVQAMIDLAEFPALVNFVVERYKPQGVRAMMNCLVKICSLNRRSPVHPACCDAIESLGYTKLASTLRESIAVVEISEPENHPSYYKVWIKKSDYNYGWTYAMRQIQGSYFSRQMKGMIVPKTAKRELWDNMLKFYGGLCAKTPKGTVKIVPKNVTAQQATSDLTPSQAAATSN